MLIDTDFLDLLRIENGNAKGWTLQDIEFGMYYCLCTLSKLKGSRQHKGVGHCW